MPKPTTAAKCGVAGLASLAAVLLSCGCAVRTQHPREAARFEGDPPEASLAAGETPTRFPLHAADRLGAELHGQSAE